MIIRKTAPKQKQVDKSEIINDNFSIASNIKTLEDDLNFIRSQIKAIKGSSSFSSSVSFSESLAGLSDRFLSNDGFVFTQSSPSSVWTITHGLARYPNIIIFDTDYNQIFAAVKMLNNNTARVTFSEPVSGAALLR
jgi:hypothetical protein